MLDEKEHIGHEYVAKELKNTSHKGDGLATIASPVVSVAQTTLQILAEKNENVQIYCRFLQHCYLKKFPESVKHPHLLPKHFINLALVTEVECNPGKDAFTDYSIRGSIDDILHIKQKIDYTDILKPDGDREMDFVLMEGRPGVGKTTLAQKLCYEWVKNKMLGEFNLVLFVQLRDFSQDDNPTLGDLLLYENPTVKAEVTSYIEKTDGKGVLFILEGWDELPLPLRQITKAKKASVFVKLIRRVYLTQATILVTSRHVATKDFHVTLQNLVSRFVEVLGLTSTDIRDFIKSYINDIVKSSDLICQLQDRPHIESMCYIPLNCQIVCELFVKQRGELPTTITKIYSQLIMSYLHRSIDNMEYFDSFADIPQKDQTTFNAICKLAFEGIIRYKLVFSQKEISDIAGIEFSETFDGFGLFQAVQSFTIQGSIKSFHFNHLTFQEYLAAYHISKHMEPSKQLDLVTKHVNSENLNNVWRFYAGISNLNSKDIAEVLCAYELDDPLDKAKLICHCAYEAQNSEVCISIANSFNSTTPQFFSVNAYECLALSYIIANSSDREWSIELRTCGIESSHIRMLTRHIKWLNSKSLALKCLDLSGNQLDYEGISNFISCAHVISGIKKLICQNTFMDNQAVNALSKFISSCPNVYSINLNNNKLTNGSLEKLLEVLQENGTTEVLSVCSNNLGINDICNISNLLENTECTKVLKLSNNCLQSRSIPGLYQGLCNNKSLQSLYLEENDIDASGVMILLATIPGSNLKHLHMKKNSVKLKSKNISHLKNHLSKIQILYKIDLSFCKMGGSVCYFIESLSGNSSLQVLKFEGSVLEGADSNLLFELLATVNNTVKRMIDLRPNTITGSISHFLKLVSTRHSHNWIYFTFCSHKSIDVTILQLKNIIDNNPNLGSTKVVYLRQTINTVHYPENILEELFSEYCFLRFTNIKQLNLEKIKQSRELEFIASTIQELPNALTSLHTTKQNDVIILIQTTDKL